MAYASVSGKASANIFDVFSLSSLLVALRRRRTAAWRRFSGCERRWPYISAHTEKEPARILGDPQKIWRSVVFRQTSWPRKTPNNTEFSALAFVAASCLLWFNGSAGRRGERTVIQRRDIVGETGGPDRNVFGCRSFDQRQHFRSRPPF